MKKHYFLIGTLLGLVCAFGVGYALMGKHFIQLWGRDSKYWGGPPILMGLMLTTNLASWFDRRNFEKSFVKSALVYPALIWLSGGIVGCLANFAVNGRFEDFTAWFFKPFYWLMVVGLPLSVVIGTIYYAVVKKMEGGRSTTE